MSLSTQGGNKACQDQGVVFATLTIFPSLIRPRIIFLSQGKSSGSYGTTKRQQPFMVQQVSINSMPYSRPYKVVCKEPSIAGNLELRKLNARFKAIQGRLLSGPYSDQIFLGAFWFYNWIVPIDRELISNITGLPMEGGTLDLKEEAKEAKRRKIIQELYLLCTEEEVWRKSNGFHINYIVDEGAKWASCIIARQLACLDANTYFSLQWVVVMVKVTTEHPYAWAPWLAKELKEYYISSQMSGHPFPMPLLVTVIYMEALGPLGWIEPNACPCLNLYSQLHKKKENKEHFTKEPFAIAWSLPHLPTIVLQEGSMPSREGRGKSTQRTPKKDKSKSKSSTQSHKTTDMEHDKDRNNNAFISVTSDSDSLLIPSHNHGNPFDPMVPTLSETDPSMESSSAIVPPLVFPHGIRAMFLRGLQAGIMTMERTLTVATEGMLLRTFVDEGTCKQNHHAAMRATTTGVEGGDSVRWHNKFIVEVGDELQRLNERLSEEESESEETVSEDDATEFQGNAEVGEQIGGVFFRARDACKGVECRDLKDTVEKIYEEIEDHASNMDIGRIAVATEECPSNMDVVGIAKETKDYATDEDLMDKIGKSDVEDVVSPKVLKGPGIMRFMHVHEEGKVVGQVNYIDGYLKYDEYVPMVNKVVDGGSKWKGQGKNCRYLKVLRHFYNFLSHALQKVKGKRKG
eukprot:Gb_29656 [translate_table: standard]